MGRGDYGLTNPIPLTMQKSWRRYLAGTVRQWFQPFWPARFEKPAIRLANHAPDGCFLYPKIRLLRIGSSTCAILRIAQPIRLGYTRLVTYCEPGGAFLSQYFDCGPSANFSFKGRGHDQSYDIEGSTLAAGIRCVTASDPAALIRLACGRIPLRTCRKAIRPRSALRLRVDCHRPAFELARSDKSGGWRSPVAESRSRKGVVKIDEQQP